jgi:hypothetical protein
LFDWLPDPAGSGIGTIVVSEDVDRIVATLTAPAIIKAITNL